MSMVQWVKNWWRKRKAQRVRTIPDSYFDGYRRLAPTTDAIKGRHCWNCRHSIAFVSWWCDLNASKDGHGCKWQPCYVADQLTKADLQAGHDDGALGRWIGLPPEPAEQSPQIGDQRG